MIEKSKKIQTNTLNNILNKSLKAFLLLMLLLFWEIIILKVFTSISNIKITTNTKTIVFFISDIILSIIFILIYYKTIKKDFKNYFNKDVIKHLKESILTWLIGFTIMAISNILISLIIENNMPQNEEAVRELINISPLYMAFQLIIYAPLTEELIFRKSIKDITNNKYIYILLSGFIFGGLHVLSSLNTPLALLYLIPYCSLGFIFAYLYHKTDNIFSTITVHSIHNTLALIIYLLLERI